MATENEDYALGRTCDSCAQFAPCRMDAETEAYVCELCDQEHETAIRAAADAVARFIYKNIASGDEHSKAVAQEAVTAYLRAAHNQHGAT